MSEIVFSQFVSQVGFFVSQMGFSICIPMAYWVVKVRLRIWGFLVIVYWCVFDHVRTSIFVLKIIGVLLLLCYG